MWKGWGRGELRTGIGWGNLRERDHVEYLGVGGRIILKLISKYERVWTGLI
jgi:hypothetical protein